MRRYGDNNIIKDLKLKRRLQGYHSSGDKLYYPHISLSPPESPISPFLTLPERLRKIYVRGGSRLMVTIFM